MGDLLGDITPSWASAPALHGSRGGEPPLCAMSWTHVSSRARGSGVTGANAGPAGVGTPVVVDADAEGDDNPSQTFVNMHAVDPAVTDPWQALETPTVPSATLAVSFPEGGSLPPGEVKTPLGDSPSNPLGVNRTVQFGATSIYEYDADTPICGPVGRASLPSPTCAGPLGARAAVCVLIPKRGALGGPVLLRRHKLPTL